MTVHGGRPVDRAARIRVADEIFGGTGGERFVELMARSEGELRQTSTGRMSWASFWAMMWCAGRMSWIENSTN